MQQNVDNRAYQFIIWWSDQRSIKFYTCPLATCLYLFSIFPKHVAVNANKSKLANATGPVLLRNIVFISKHVYVFFKGHKRIKKKVLDLIV